MPFHTAIETNDEDTFKYLLIKTEQVRKVMHRTDKMNFIPTKDLIGHRQLTPIMLSLDHRSGNIFQTLLDFKADLSLTNDQGNNIYHLVLNWQMADRLGPLLNVEHFDPIFLQHKNHQHYSPLAEMVKLNDP